MVVTTTQCVRPVIKLAIASGYRALPTRKSSLSSQTRRCTVRVASALALRFPRCKFSAKGFAISQRVAPMQLLLQLAHNLDGVTISIASYCHSAHYTYAVAALGLPRLKRNLVSAAGIGSGLSTKA